MINSKTAHLIYILLSIVIFTALTQMISLNKEYMSFENCCVITDIIHDTLIKSASVYDINALIKK